MSIITGEMTKDAIFSIVNSDHHLAEIVVERERERLTTYQERLKRLQEFIEGLDV